MKRNKEKKNSLRNGWVWGLGKSQERNKSGGDFLDHTVQKILNNIIIIKEFTHP